MNNTVSAKTMQYYKNTNNISFLENIEILMPPDKRGYPQNISLISPLKHILWVLIKSVWVRCL